MQTCPNINLHVVNTDICSDLHVFLSIAQESRPIQCAQHKLKIVYKI